MGGKGMGCGGNPLLEVQPLQCARKIVSVVADGERGGEG